MKSSIEYSMEVRDTSKNFILEFGVFEGNTIRRIKELSNNDDKIYGFDSFEGLPESWEGTVCGKGFFSTNGNIPNVEGVNFIKGWFDDSLPNVLNELSDISVLHVDCDLYSSTKTVMWSLNHLIKPNTIMCFDEWIYRKADGVLCDDHEQKCFYEYVSEFEREFEFIDFNDSTGCGFERKIVRILK